jgi:hypothetical protein
MTVAFAVGSAVHARAKPCHQAYQCSALTARCSARHVCRPMCVAQRLLIVVECAALTPWAPPPPTIRCHLSCERVPFLARAHKTRRARTGPPAAPCAVTTAHLPMPSSLASQPPSPHVQPQAPSGRGVRASVVHALGGRRRPPTVAIPQHGAPAREGPGCVSRRAWSAER